MNDETEITVDTINAKLEAAFQHLYPDLSREEIVVEHREDETIVVRPGDFPAQRAVIYSDDDGTLSFTPFDEDDDALADDHDFMSLRIRIFPEA